ncbi:hypothetical protein ACF0H5_012390 [Mactra antiquata]
MNKISDEIEVISSEVIDGFSSENDSLLTDSGCFPYENEPKTNLDKYLEELYIKEIEYPINDEEVSFIQTGIETYVTQIARLTRTNAQVSIQKEIQKFQSVFRGLKNLNEDYTEEVGVLNCGSFFEGAKVAFPDEFDFIFFLGSFQSDDVIRSVVRYDDARYSAVFELDTRDRDNFVHNAIHRESGKVKGVHFMDVDAGEMFVEDVHTGYCNFRERRTVIFDKYVIIDEKASKLRFLYKNEYGLCRYIHVQIIPAFRVYEPSCMRKTDEICSSPFVPTEVSKTGSVCVVSGLVWFTETEVNFMRNVLSKRHLKVYKVVKYLIGDKKYADAIYDKLVETGLWQYNTGIVTSYMIKTGMINHHYSCKHKESDGESGCILDMLTYLANIKSDQNIQLLTDVVHTPNFFRSEERYCKLRDMISTFQMLRNSRDQYVYENCCVTPLNKSLLQYFQGNAKESKKVGNTIPTSLGPPKKGLPKRVLICSEIIKYLLIISAVTYALTIFDLVMMQ